MRDVQSRGYSGLGHPPPHSEIQRAEVAWETDIPSLVGYLPCQPCDSRKRMSTLSSQFLMENRAEAPGQLS